MGPYPSAGVVVVVLLMTAPSSMLGVRLAPLLMGTELQCVAVRVTLTLLALSVGRDLGVGPLQAAGLTCAPSLWELWRESHTRTPVFTHWQSKQSR